MKEEVSFYEDNPINLNLIRDTFQAAFRNPFNENIWNWRFKENPCTDKLKIAYIIKNGKLASYYAVNPMDISLHDRPYKAALSLMTMTHPEFAGQGLFKKLASALFNKLKGDNFLSVYGFANSNSHYGFRKHLGWHDLMPMYNLKSMGLKSFEVPKFIEDGDVGPDVISILSKLKYSTGKISLLRDINYLNYRLLNNPIYSYKYCVLDKGQGNSTTLIYKLYNHEIDIMEIFFSDGEQYLESLKSLLNYLEGKYNRRINIWSNFHNKEHLELEKMGFTPSGFNSFFGIVPLSEEPLLLEYENWHIRFIDSDIF